MQKHVGDNTIRGLVRTGADVTGSGVDDVERADDFEETGNRSGRSPERRSENRFVSCGEEKESKGQRGRMPARASRER